MPDYDNSAKSYLAQNLNIIMSVWKMDQHEFAKLIDLNYPTFNNYMNLKTFPRVPTLLVIADVTGIAMDIYLRQMVPIHLIPERPLTSGSKVSDMVKDRELLYRPEKSNLIDYSTLERRLEGIEQQVRQILERLDIAKD